MSAPVVDPRSMIAKPGIRIAMALYLCLEAGIREDYDELKTSSWQHEFTPLSFARSHVIRQQNDICDRLCPDLSFEKWVCYVKYLSENPDKTTHRLKN